MAGRVVGSRFACADAVHLTRAGAELTSAVGQSYLAIFACHLAPLVINLPCSTIVLVQLWKRMRARRTRTARGMPTIVGLLGLQIVAIAAYSSIGAATTLAAWLIGQRRGGPGTPINRDLSVCVAAQRPR